MKPVKLHQEFNFTENYSEVEPTQEQLDEEDTIVTVKDDKIDLQKAVEDNLLLSLPSVILTPQEKVKVISLKERDGRLFLKRLIKKNNQIRKIQPLLSLKIYSKMKKTRNKPLH